MFKFCFFERDIVGIPAEDVFELAFKFVDIVIGFTSELELYLFVSNLSPFLFLGSLVEVLPQVLNDAVKVMSMFLPKLAELLRSRFINFKEGISDLKSVAH